MNIIFILKTKLLFYSLVISEDRLHLFVRDILLSLSNLKIISFYYIKIISSWGTIIWQVLELRWYMFNSHTILYWSQYYACFINV